MKKSSIIKKIEKIDYLLVNSLFLYLSFQKLVEVRQSCKKNLFLNLVCESLLSSMYINLHNFFDKKQGSLNDLLKYIENKMPLLRKEIKEIKDFRDSKNDLEKLLKDLRNEIFAHLSPDGFDAITLTEISPKKNISSLQNSLETSLKNLFQDLFNFAVEIMGKITKLTSSKMKETLEDIIKREVPKRQEIINSGFEEMVERLRN
jgi:DNA repair exonuclease SbcCD ATPase subunit